MFKCLNVKMNKAFTLVEMLVSILIFSIIIGAATGVFVSAIKLQRYSLTHQQLLDQTSYAMEYMSRAIRMAQKDDDTCGFSGENYGLVGSDSIEFKTYHGQCWRFFLEDERLKIDKDGDGPELPYDLTSDKFKVETFKVDVSGDEAEKQPKITIFMEVQGIGVGSQPRLRIQTTISQRNLNI